MRPLRALGLLLILTLAACAESVREARHVVVISLDTTRADHFGFLGNSFVQTPRIDALARQAIVFSDYATVVPTTLASHTSLFTGRYPHHHGTPRNGFMVHEANEMLPEILKRAGFHTAGFAGSFALGSRFDFAQGFDHYDAGFDAAVVPGSDATQRSAARVTDAVTHYLDETGVPKRLFLFVHYFDPHRPYAAPEPFRGIYDTHGGDLPELEALTGPSRLGARQKRRYARRHALRYAEEISYLDDQVGRLVDELRQRGILEDALLLVTSDHGETHWENEEGFNHGWKVYQTTIRGVGLIRLPGARLAGTRLDHPVSSIDILPTILGLLGLQPPSEVDGEPIPLGPADERFRERLRFGEATKPLHVETDSGWLNSRKARYVRHGGFKLIQTPYAGTEELYDLESDPSERNDLLLDPSPEVEALARRLRSELQSWTASAKPLPTSFEPSQVEETMRRLRSLGYLQ